jgi:hypothetical protein
MHAFDMCGGMNEDVKGNDAGHHGMTIRSRLIRVDGQGGDQPNDEFCLVDLEELWQRVVNHGKDGVAEDYSEENLWGASSLSRRWRP